MTQVIFYTLLSSSDILSDGYSEQIKTIRKHCPSLRGRNEAFRGLPQWQAVPSEGSTVLCATEDPIGSEMEC